MLTPHAPQRAIKYRTLVHVSKRCQERFEMDLNEHDLNVMGATIRSGKADVIRRLSRTKVIFGIEWEGCYLPVIYSSKRKTVITVLPPEEAYCEIGIDATDPKAKQDAELLAEQVDAVLGKLSLERCEQTPRSLIADIEDLLRTDRIYLVAMLVMRRIDGTTEEI